MTDSNDHPFRSASQTNDADDRKLWFDYIHSLNERQLQESQRSGVTTYVLLGTIVALIYRFGPHLPQFLTRIDTVKASITIFVLLVVGLTSFDMTVYAIGHYLAGGNEFRAVPKSSQTLIPFLYGFLSVVILGFVSLETWVAISSADRFRKYVLLGHALFWVFTAILFLFRYGQAVRKARTLRNLLPHFDLFRQSPRANLVAVVLPVTWIVLVAVCLVRYAKILPGYGLQPFKAAIVAFIAIAIVAYLTGRNVANASRQKYFGLERDIVLNRMTSSEIRERYLRDLSGPDMAQWLDDALAKLEAKERELESEQERAEGRVKEIVAIDPGYRAERRERAKAASGGLDRAIDEYLSQCKVLTFQTEVFVSNYMTADEIKALRQRFEILKTRTATLAERLESARAVLINLKELAGDEP
jgi:hypothetical protein